MIQEANKSPWASLKEINPFTKSLPNHYQKVYLLIGISFKILLKWEFGGGDHKHLDSGNN